MGILKLTDKFTPERLENDYKKALTFMIKIIFLPSIQRYKQLLILDIYGNSKLSSNSPKYSIIPLAFPPPI